LARDARFARDDRKAGIVLTSLPCPALVVASTGDATFPPPAYADLSVPAERLVVDGATHWGLVLNRRLLDSLVPTVTAWLEGAGGGGGRAVTGWASDAWLAATPSRGPAAPGGTGRWRD